MTAVPLSGKNIVFPLKNTKFDLSLTEDLDTATRKICLGSLWRFVLRSHFKVNLKVFSSNAFHL